MAAVDVVKLLANEASTKIASSVREFHCAGVPDRGLVTVEHRRPRGRSGAAHKPGSVGAILTLETAIRSRG